MELKIGVGEGSVVDDLSASAYLGTSRAKMISTTTNYNSNNVYDNGITYGAGLEYNILCDVSIHLEYMHYFKNLNAVEFGLGFRF